VSNDLFLLEYFVAPDINVKTGLKRYNRSGPPAGGFFGHDGCLVTVPLPLKRIPPTQEMITAEVLCMNELIVNGEK
jgi:hypothetical protein